MIPFSYKMESYLKNFFYLPDGKRNFYNTSFGAELRNGLF